MKNLKLLFVFLLFCNMHLTAQNTNNDPINYKLTFIDIDQYQLKEMIPICMELFDVFPEHREESIYVLYFDSNNVVTEQELKAKLLENNITHKFTLNTTSDEK